MSRKSNREQRSKAGNPSNRMTSPDALPQAVQAAAEAKIGTTYSRGVLIGQQIAGTVFVDFVAEADFDEELELQPEFKPKLLSMVRTYAWGTEIPLLWMDSEGYGTLFLCRRRQQLPTARTTG